MLYWGIAFDQYLYVINTGSEVIFIISSNSFLTLLINISLSMLPISGFLAPPMKSVKAAVVSSVLSGNITELHIAPRKDFLSLDGIRKPNPSNGCPISFFLYAR